MWDECLEGYYSSLGGIRIALIRVLKVEEREVDWGKRFLWGLNQYNLHWGWHRESCQGSLRFLFVYVDQWWCHLPRLGTMEGNWIRGLRGKGDEYHEFSLQLLKLKCVWGMKVKYQVASWIYGCRAQRKCLRVGK